MRIVNHDILVLNHSKNQLSSRKMESLGSKLLISSTPYWIKSFQTKTIGTNFRYMPFILNSKKSNYQDFQEYARPLRLLPSTKAETWADTLSEKAICSFMPRRYESMYKVGLQTSKIYGSGLTDMNAGVLVCLIDENGSSILQRLPTTSEGTDKWSADRVIADNLHFQRGFVDEFAFEGPKLGKIVAIWISLESGQWRVGGMSLTVINNSQQSTIQENKHQAGLLYNFEVEDALLGENSETSMIEFRPYSVTAFSEDELPLFNENSLNKSSPLDSYLTSNEESMKEYSDLKFSLLIYDSMLILAGSSLISFLKDESASYAFLTGGMCGFLYLLLLQKSVDGLAADQLIPSEGKEHFGQIFRRLKGPISSLVLASAFGIIAVKYASGEDAVRLTSKDLVFGMMGFLLCKVSVVLSAFKPMPFGLRDEKEQL